MFLVAVTKGCVATYPEIIDASLKSTLCTFKQCLALKMRERYGISIVLL